MSCWSPGSGARLASPRAGVVAAVISTYSLVVGIQASDGMALHGEALQLPFLLIGIAGSVLATRARARRTGWLVLAGIAFGASISIKQSVLLQPIGAVLWLIAESSRLPTARRRSQLAGQLALFVGAITVVPLAFVLHAVLDGTIDAFVYYTVTYNFGVHLKPTTTLFKSASLIPIFDEALHETSFFTATVALLVVLTAFVWRRARRARALGRAAVLVRPFGVRVYFAIHFFIALASGAGMARFFGHYFVPAVAFMALAIGAWTQRALVRTNAQRTLAAAAALALVFIGTAAAYMNEKIDGTVAHDELPLHVGRYIDATTPRDARIFVWGFSPWLYGYSHRRPAGRFVFATYVTGFVPWFHDQLPLEPSRAVPGAMNALLEDLERERPEVVVDAGSVEIGRALRAYPAMAHWLTSEFCFEVRTGAYDIYRRKPAGGCATDAFPVPHVVVDYEGKPMVVPVKPLPPSERSVALPAQILYEDVVWYPDQPTPTRLDLLAIPRVGRPNSR